MTKPMSEMPPVRHPEKIHRPDNPSPRKPDWIRVKAPTSAEAAEVRRLLIGAHKSCIETIYLALDALERAPGKKSSLPYMPWELRACESIMEISEMGGPASLKEIPELRD